MEQSGLEPVPKQDDSTAGSSLAHYATMAVQDKSFYC